MTQPNPTDDLEAVEMIANIIESHMYVMSKHNPEMARVAGHNSTAQAILAALRPAGVGEAVAWRWRKVGDPLWDVMTNREFPPMSPPHGYEQEPLYTHPATPAHPDAALMERVREALDEVNDGLLRIARIQDAPGDLETVKEALEWAHAGAIVAMCGPKFTEARALLSDLKAEAGR